MPVPTSYAYDGNGNVITKTEPAGFSTSFTYDLWNRLVSKSYMGGNTIQADFCFDGASHNGGGCTGGEQAGLLGRMTAFGNANSWTNYTIDTSGRITASTQSTKRRNGTTFTPPNFAYAYYADGSLSHMQYPSGSVVTTCYDTNGRPLWVSKNRSESQCQGIASGVAYLEAHAIAGVSAANGYAAHGAGAGWQLGNALTGYAKFNNRLQTYEMGLGTSRDVWKLENFFTSAVAASNNGNVMKQVLTVPGMANLTTVYTYDAVNRLKLAAEKPVNESSPACPGVSSNGWCYGYRYDEYGNRTIESRYPNGAADEPGAYTAASNRINGNAWGYNARGDLIKRSTGDQMSYDAEGRMTADCGAAATVCNDQDTSAWVMRMVYDAQGRRVRTDGGSVSTTYVYDAAGELAAEYGGIGTAVGIHYVTTDHLGSTRVLTDDAKTPAYTDYEPFGTEVMGSPRSGVTGYGVATGMKQKFTGTERDSETGLDYFGARYFSGAQGRFTSPDEPLVDQDESDPQSWNLYSYVRNNPLRFIDPTGRDCVTLDNGTTGDNGQGKMCQAVLDANKNKKPDVTVTGTPEPITWAQYFGFDFAYRRAVNQQIEIDAAAGRWDKVPIMRGEIPIGPPAAAGANALRGIWSSTNKLSAVRNAFAHWLKHGREFPNLQNAKQYVEEAIEFVTHPPAGTLSKLRANGDTVLYNPATNTFAVKTAAGAPRTMFKPSGGMAYFNGQ